MSKGLPRTMKNVSAKQTSLASTTALRGTAKQATYQAPAAAADTAALKVQFDALLARMVAAGLMASS